MRPAARLKMQVDSKPEELNSIDREIVRLKIEQEALKKETDPGSKDRLKRLETELKALEKQSADITTRWKAEKEKLSDAQKLKTELDQLRAELANAQRKGEYQRAGELAYGRIPELEKKLKDNRSLGRQARRDGRGDRHRRSRGRRGFALDRRAGRPNARGRKGKVAAHGRRACQARHRPAGRGACGFDGSSTRPRRLAGSAPAYRLVHVFGANRRRQDRTDQGVG